MKSGSYRDAVVKWALGLPTAGKLAATVDERVDGSAMQSLVERFALAGVERRLVELGWAADRSAEVAAHVRAGDGELTVERARTLLADASVDELLAPSGKLVVHGLLVVGDGGATSARSTVRIAHGLAARLDGTPRSAELAAGIRRIGPTVDGTFWVERFAPSARGAEIVKAELVATENLLATVAGCSAREAYGVGVALARRLGRAVIVVDGSVLAAQSAAWELLAAVRRDVDLDGDVLLVHHVVSVGGALIAAAAPAPKESARPSLVIFADPDDPPEILIADGFTVRAVTLYATAPAKGAEVVEAAKPPPPKDDGFEQIRQQASRDADRAMGIIRVETARPNLAPAPPRPATTAAPQPPVSAPSTASDRSVDASTSAAAVAAPSSSIAAPAVAPASEPARPRRRSRKAIEHFGPLDDSPPEPPQRSAPAPLPALSESIAAAAEAAGSDAPRVQLSSEPTPDEMARVATSSPNAAQRIELMSQLAGHKSAAVVSALRNNARSENPAVRAIAEAVMAQMFGDKWNSARAVPKPVQPPRSDDKDRGPPGGW